MANKIAPREVKTTFKRKDANTFTKEIRLKSKLSLADAIVALSTNGVAFKLEEYEAKDGSGKKNLWTAFITQYPNGYKAFNVKSTKQQANKATKELYTSITIEIAFATKNPIEYDESKSDYYLCDIAFNSHSWVFKSKPVQQDKRVEEELEGLGVEV